MKKLRIIIILLAIFIPSIVYARSDTITVTLNKCVDGDTAIFNYEDSLYKVRFLAIDTKELKNHDKYADIALDYTCNELKNAKKIKLEFDSNSDEKDKYGRYLAWVFVDDTLLQEKLIKKGYAQTKYLYGDYKYTNKLKKEEKIAKRKKLGIWSDYKLSWKDYINEYIDYINIAIIIICIILGISVNKIRKILKLIKKS